MGQMNFNNSHLGEAYTELFQSRCSLLLYEVIAEPRVNLSEKWIIKNIVQKKYLSRSFPWKNLADTYKNNRTYSGAASPLHVR